MCTMLSVPVNAVLTPLMVRILNWGVAGASISTVLESVASLIALIIVLKKGKRIIKLTVKKPSVEDFKEIARVGGPKTAEGFFGGISILLMSIVIVMSGCGRIDDTWLSILHPMSIDRGIGFRIGGHTTCVIYRSR